MLWGVTVASSHGAQHHGVFFWQSSLLLVARHAAGPLYQCLLRVHGVLPLQQRRFPHPAPAWEAAQNWLQKRVRGCRPLG